MNKENRYNGVFKSTLLFSVVEVVRLLIVLIRNKFVAILLGAEGMGMIGIFSTTINFIKTGAGLGLSQSAVRDVSEAKGSGVRNEFSRVVSLVNTLVILTSLLGLVVTLLLSPFLSKWGFGNFRYTVSFLVLALAVAFNIYVDNQLAILKGMRQLRSLAKASVIGAVVALVTGIPLFFIFGKEGIVPSIVISAFSTLLVSSYYVRKIDYDHKILSLKKVYREGLPMIKMGCALMFVNFYSYANDFLVLAIIRHSGGVSDIGLFQAGATIITSYFGIVLTAMTTDYYPRISAINQDNSLLSKEMNIQSELGLLLVIPLAVLFVLVAPLAIRILYSEEFISVTKYTDIAIFGALIGVCSNCIAMILLAKQDSKAFLIISFSVCTFNTALSVYLYNRFQLIGLGISYFINIVVQFIIYILTMKKRYNISFNRRIVLLLFIFLVVLLLAVLVRRLDSITGQTITAVALLIATCCFSLYRLSLLGISFRSIVARINK